jgi:hypothetical protein
LEGALDTLAFARKVAIEEYDADEVELDVANEDTLADPLSEGFDVFVDSG